ncbi:MAG: trmB [Friedmanniella sp.]|nr:trmB [Friedmanniella sp.]
MTTDPDPQHSRERTHRDVVSFVRRSTRMRPNQRSAWEAHRGHLVLDVDRRETSTSVHPGARLDLATAYGREAPLIVEIGPGTGESLVPMAAARPDADLLVFEVYQPAIAQILAAVVRAGLTNVRVVEANAAEGLEHLLEPASVEELWTFFPDPWPKARHHKRRLVSTAFADLAARRLRPGGLWRLATDWEDYAEQMRSVLDAHPDFVNEAGQGYATRWADRPVTRFERRGLDRDRTIRDLTYRRVQSRGPESASG